MAVVSSPIPGLIRSLESVAPRIALTAVKEIKDVAKREARRDVGGDGRMSNVGRRGAKLGTRDDWKPGRSQATVRAVPPGPWSWITDGVGPHLIGVGRASKKTGNYSARQFGAGRRKRIHHGVGPTGWSMAPVFHRGTKPGKGTWRRVRKQAPALLAKAARKETARWARG